MSAPADVGPVLILAPRGRDAVVAKTLLRDAGLAADICLDTKELLEHIQRGAGTALVTEEAISEHNITGLASWVRAQPPWSDFPFVILTEHGGGIERNPAAVHLMRALGNVSFLERPFHPTTLASVVQAALRGRSKQYECQKLNDELEARVRERTAELEAANRQLLAQIEERERIESTLRQMQRLEAVGQLTSGVAHDFNNLLTVVLGNLTFVEKGITDAGLAGKLLQRLSYMRMAAERGAKLTDQLLSFSRRQRLEPKALDINASVTGMGELLHSTMGGSITIESQLSPDVWPALADPTQLELAILNLAINARDAMDGIGRLVIRTGNVTLGQGLRPEEPGPGDYVVVSVSDSGTGMTEEVRAKALEPFFTTKGVGKGSGLGLSQVLGFAKQSGGGLRIETRLGKGTAIAIYLPRAEKVSSDSVSPQLSQAADNFRGAVILLVDDDDAVRDITASLLRDLGYAVVDAGSGGAALEVLDSTARLDLMLIDFAMPGMSGADVARLAGLKRPGLPILFITGYADRAALAGVSEAHIIGKPFIDAELSTKIRTALVTAAPGGKVIRLRNQAER